MAKGIERNFQKDLEPEVYQEALASVGTALGSLAHNLADESKEDLAGHESWIESDARLVRWDIYETEGYQALKKVVEEKDLTLRVLPFARGDEDEVCVSIITSRD